MVRFTIDDSSQIHSRMPNSIVFRRRRRQQQQQQHNLRTLVSFQTNFSFHWVHTWCLEFISIGLNKIEWFGNASTSHWTARCEVFIKILRLWPIIFIIRGLFLLLFNKHTHETRPITIAVIILMNLLSKNWCLCWMFMLLLEVNYSIDFVKTKKKPMWLIHVCGKIC